MSYSHAITEFIWAPVRARRQRLAEFALAPKQILALPAAAAVLVCLEGELWLTRDGDSADYILAPGQRCAIGRGDKAAVQALRPSRLRLEGPPGG